MKIEDEVKKAESDLTPKEDEEALKITAAVPSTKREDGEPKSEKVEKVPAKDSLPLKQLWAELVKEKKTAKHQRSKSSKLSKRNSESHKNSIEENITNTVMELKPKRSSRKKAKRPRSTHGKAENREKLRKKKDRS